MRSLCEGEGFLPKLSYNVMRWKPCSIEPLSCLFHVLPFSSSEFLLVAVQVLHPCLSLFHLFDCCDFLELTFSSLSLFMWHPSKYMADDNKSSGCTFVVTLENAVYINPGFLTQSQAVLCQQHTSHACSCIVPHVQAQCSCSVRCVLSSQMLAEEVHKSLMHGS